MLSQLALVFVILIPVCYYLLKPSSLDSIPNATPNLPLIGNAISFGLDPIQFLLNQRNLHGDIFLVNLGVFKVIFFLGPEGTNAIFKGTDRGGISFLSAMTYVIGPTLEKGIHSKLRD
jgi:sterol 14-demethylase